MAENDKPVDTVSGLHTRLDLDNILKLRLVVARFGEMDMAKWWKCYRPYRCFHSQIRLAGGRTRPAGTS